MQIQHIKEVLLALLANAWVCDSSLGWIAGSNHAGAWLPLSFDCCVLSQRSPTECGVFGCDRDASIMRRLWPTRSCRRMEQNLKKEQTRNQ